MKPSSPSLFDRIAFILEQARGNVARAVNLNMVQANWLIGREIVELTQEGKERAEYGKKELEKSSLALSKKYGSGFSLTNLKYFRSFYLCYSDRQLEISHPTGDLLHPNSKSHPMGDLLIPKFSPQLSWSHYRALMRVKKPEARAFYEQETIECGWDKRALERHIHSHYYERILKSQHPETMKNETRALATNQSFASDTLKSPFVLEFLGLPESPLLYENQLESAIITHLQAFLLELGKGFAFVARQKRMIYEDQTFFVDLVFYNCILKCYLLIDLKVGELSHQDVGQMDSYVRMFEDLCTAEDDNPTIGLILCAEKNEAIAKYSILSERKQIFASKYMLYLPSEEELSVELARERKLIEEHLQEGRS